MGLYADGTLPASAPKMSSPNGDPRFGLGLAAAARGVGVTV